MNTGPLGASAIYSWECRGPKCHSWVQVRCGIGQDPPTSAPEGWLIVSNGYYHQRVYCSVQCLIASYQENPS